MIRKLPAKLNNLSIPPGESPDQTSFLPDFSIFPPFSTDLTRFQVFLCAWSSTIPRKTLQISSRSPISARKTARIRPIHAVRVPYQKRARGNGQGGEGGARLYIVLLTGSLGSHTGTICRVLLISEYSATASEKIMNETIQDPMTKAYNPIGKNQQALIDQIKDCSSELFELFNQVDNLMDARCGHIAKTRLEEAVMWGIKGVRSVRQIKQ